MTNKVRLNIQCDVIYEPSFVTSDEFRNICEVQKIIYRISIVSVKCNLLFLTQINKQQFSLKCADFKSKYNDKYFVDSFIEEI